jgi:hypothetical protein
MIQNFGNRQRFHLSDGNIGTSDETWQWMLSNKGVIADITCPTIVSQCQGKGFYPHALMSD